MINTTVSKPEVLSGVKMAVAASFTKTKGAVTQQFIDQPMLTKVDPQLDNDAQHKNLKTGSA